MPICMYVLHKPLRWFRQVYIIQEIIKQARKRFAKVKNEELINITVIDFTYQDFVIVFSQIALDLFRTSYNTHTTQTNPKELKKTKKRSKYKNGTKSGR
jgi:hypothetical protein